MRLIRPIRRKFHLFQSLWRTCKERNGCGYAELGILV
jgi:hypothetical protein